jgi:hypothetical protein
VNDNKKKLVGICLFPEERCLTVCSRTSKDHLYHFQWFKNYVLTKQVSPSTKQQKFIKININSTERKQRIKLFVISRSPISKLSKYKPYDCYSQFHPRVSQHSIPRNDLLPSEYRYTSWVSPHEGWTFRDYQRMRRVSTDGNQIREK